MAQEAYQLLGLIVLASLVWLYLVEYRKYRVDLLRHRLFVARDNLFEAAKRGEISFYHPAYGITRTTLNGMLRFAHEMTLARVLITFVFHAVTGSKAIVKQHREEYFKRFQTATSDLSDDQKNLIFGTLAKAHVSVLSHIVHTSPLMVWWVSPIVWLLRVLHWLDLPRLLRSRRINKPLQTFDAEANFMGCEGRVACQS